MRIRYWCSDVFSSELAVCGSPLRNSVAASSSSALAKAGSRPARSLTVSLKSRVIVMSSPFRRCLARLVFALEQSRSLDGRLLTPLGAARKQDDQLLAVLHQLEPVARSEEHTSEIQSLMRLSYAVLCLKKKKHNRLNTNTQTNN